MQSTVGLQCVQIYADCSALILLLVREDQLDVLCCQGKHFNERCQGLFQAV